MNTTFKWLASLALVAILSSPAVAADDKKPTSTAKPVVAVFRLHPPIVETPVDEVVLFGGGHQPTSLKDLVRRMAKAKDDEAVKAVVLLMEGPHLGTAQVEELRQAIADINKSGKNVYAHADSLDMREYVLMSGATHLSVVPTGDLWLTGLYGESMFLRGLLTKLGVKPDFLTCGQYKSAAETYMRDGPSPQAEEMQNWLLDSIYRTQVKLIASGRGVEEEKARGWIDGGPYSANKARDLGIIDAVEERQELEARLKHRFGDDVKFDHKYGVASHQQVDSRRRLRPSRSLVRFSTARKRRSTRTPWRSSTSTEQSRSAKWKRIRCSAAAPGPAAPRCARVGRGCGRRYDQSRRAAGRFPRRIGHGQRHHSRRHASREGQEAVGGFHGQRGRQRRLLRGLCRRNDLCRRVDDHRFHWGGRRQDRHDRHVEQGRHHVQRLSARQTCHAAQFGPDLHAVGREHMQAWMDEIYGVFKGHVIEARGKKLKKPIDDLAGGRVYTGRQALELGLVDKIGTLEDAITAVATEAKLDKYDVRVVPEPKNFLQLLLEETTDDKSTDKRLEARFTASESPLLRAALPLLGKLDPERLAAVRLAILRLDMIQREGVVLMAPEMLLGK